MRSTTPTARGPADAPRAVHLSHRSNWLRAAVLGANDGIVSTASLVLGVAASGASGTAIVTAGIAGLVAGALSMAAGRVRVGQLAARRRAGRHPPGGARARARPGRRAARARRRSTRERGLPLGAGERGRADAVAPRRAAGARRATSWASTSARLARPFQAAWASALSFSAGAALPLLAVARHAAAARVATTVVVTLVALGLLGDLGARLGGAPRRHATRAGPRLGRRRDGDHRRDRRARRHRRLGDAPASSVDGARRTGPRRSGPASVRA